MIASLYQSGSPVGDAVSRARGRRRRRLRVTGSSRSRARCGRAGARGRRAPGCRAGRARRSCARRARGSARRRAGRAPGRAASAVDAERVQRQVHPARSARDAGSRFTTTSDDVGADRRVLLGVGEQLRRCRPAGSAGGGRARSAGLSRADRVDARDQRRAGCRGCVELPVRASGTSRSRGTPRCPARARALAAARRPGRRCRSWRPAWRPAPGAIANAGRPPDCRYSCRMSGVLAHRLGRRYSRTSVCVSSVKYSVSSALGVAPGEVGVRLGEAELGQAVHHLRPRERLGQEDHLGVLARRTSRDQPLPERERLGVRVVDAEDAHALLDPEAGRRRCSSSHSAAPVARSRSRAGRCPGTSWAGSRRTGSCRRAGGGTTPGARATQGWSGEHWKAMSSASSRPCSRAAATQAAEVVERAELGVDRGVAALGGADAPTGCRGRRAGAGRVVRPLAVGARRSGGSAAGRGRRSPSPAM